MKSTPARVWMADEKDTNKMHLIDLEEDNEPS